MINVIKPGFLTTIQDKGRFGYAAFGVPIAGAMDAYSYQLANKILNNTEDAAVLEITLGNATLEFLVDTQITICGADLSATLNGKKISLNARITISKNDVINFKTPIYGVRTYLAVKGGIRSDKILNSRSQSKNITESHQLKKGDFVPIDSYQSNTKITSLVIKVNTSHFTTEILKCTKGPEFNLLSEKNQQELFNKVFSIAKENSRMGYKLNEIIPNKIPQILTSAVMPGTVQLTPSGTLIVLMRDCQVTGGYPRILQLTAQAIHVLAQKSTNNCLKFSL